MVNWHPLGTMRHPLEGPSKKHYNLQKLCCFHATLDFRAFCLAILTSILEFHFFCSNLVTRCPKDDLSRAETRQNTVRYTKAGASARVKRPFLLTLNSDRTGQNAWDEFFSATVMRFGRFRKKKTLSLFKFIVPNFEPPNMEVTFHDPKQIYSWKWDLSPCPNFRSNLFTCRM